MHIDALDDEHVVGTTQNAVADPGPPARAVVGEQLDVVAHVVAEDRTRLPAQGGVRELPDDAVLLWQRCARGIHEFDEVMLRGHRVHSGSELARDHEVTPAAAHPVKDRCAERRGDAVAHGGVACPGLTTALDPFDPEGIDPRPDDARRAFDEVLGQ